MLKLIPDNFKSYQEGLLKKKYSATEVVDYFLDRITKHNPKLNAFITTTSNEAYDAARVVDELISQNDPGILKKYPLLGLTVAHKDLFLTKGVRTTAAAKVLTSYIPEYSATIVNKIGKAGGIMLGKTNCDAWAHGASGENSDFGATKNPWNYKYVPGGSSSGSAAAVAAKLTQFSTGTDTGGSIRQPANFCGVVGFKPTYGTVSRYGVIAMASSLDTVGHLTSLVSEAKLIFDTIKGKDDKDATLINGKNKDIFSRPKIGIPKEYFSSALDSEVKNSVEKTIDFYSKNGCEIEEVSLPNTPYAISVYYIIQPAEVSSNLARFDGIRFGDNREAFNLEAKRRIMLGTYVLSSGYYDAYYLKAMKVRAKIIQDFESVFSKVDALITPVSPTLPFKIGERTTDPLKMYLADILTVSANIAGLPGLAIPSGLSENKLPLGFQIIGPRFSENILFSLGELYQDKNPKMPEVNL